MVKKFNNFITENASPSIRTCTEYKKAIVYSNGKYLPNFYELKFSEGEPCILSFDDINSIVGIANIEEVVGQKFDFDIASDI